MARPAEIFRSVVGKTEVGLPKFTPEERRNVLTKAKAFVGELRGNIPEAGVERSTFFHWVPQKGEFARPEKIGANVHAYHDIRHVASVVGMEMFLVPVVEHMYQERLPKDRKILPNAVYAGAKGHDLLRGFDVLGAQSKTTYKLHGQHMAEAIRSGKYFPELSDTERSIAADSIAYHDVDPRNPKMRHPEDELLAIVDREELARLIYGVGFWPKAGRLWGRVSHNFFEKQRDSYVSHYFPGLAEKIRPVSEAMLLLGLEEMKKGMPQDEAVWSAMQQLGMTKNPQENPATQ